MMSAPVRVAVTAFTRLSTTFTTPPTMLTVLQRRPPNRLVLQVCGGEVYCTMTLTRVEALDEMSGSRSGEILESSASAMALANRNITIAADPLNHRQRENMAALEATV